MREFYCFKTEMCGAEAEMQLVPPEESHLVDPIFSSLPIKQDEIDTFLSTLSEWTRTLLTHVEAGLPKGQSQWQD